MSAVIRKVGRWKKIYIFICSDKFRKHAKYIIAGAVALAVAICVFHLLTGR